MRGEKLVIETPEKIIFSYTLAEIGTRIAAYTIDIIIQILILVVMFLLLGLSFLSADAFGDDQLYYYFAIIIILLFIFQWGYFVFFETILNGRTPGKQICHIRVIPRSGERLEFSTIVVRNLLRAADSIPLPFFNILGGLVAIIDRKNRRLGDMAAGTVVVTDSLFSLKEPDFETKIENRAGRFFARPGAGSRLSEKDLFILRKLINERGTIPRDVEEKTAALIVEKLKARYDLSPAAAMSDFEIIEEIYKAHTYEDEE